MKGLECKIEGSLVFVTAAGQGFDILAVGELTTKELDEAIEHLQQAKAMAEGYEKLYSEVFGKPKKQTKAKAPAKPRKKKAEAEPVPDELPENPMTDDELDSIVNTSLETVEPDAPEMTKDFDNDPVTEVVF